MRAGMFGRNGVIELYVDDSGYVVNGNWDVEYHGDTDEVSCARSPEMGRAQRVCDLDPALVRGDYNDVIEAHRRYERKP